MTGEQRDRAPGCTTLRLIFLEQGRSIFPGAGHPLWGGFPGLDGVQIWVMGISE